MEEFDNVVQAKDILEIDDNYRILVAAREINNQLEVINLSARKDTFQCLCAWWIEYVWANAGIIWYWEEWWLFDDINQIAEEIEWLKEEVALRRIEEFKEKKKWAI